ncbi:hypothetical protein JCM6882_008700 [Rhodosporidiobolus microsporus]
MDALSDSSEPSRRRPTSSRSPARARQSDAESEDRGRGGGEMESTEEEGQIKEHRSEPRRRQQRSPSSEQEDEWDKDDKASEEDFEQLKEQDEDRYSQRSGGYSPRSIRSERSFEPMDVDADDEDVRRCRVYLPNVEERWEKSKEKRKEGDLDKRYQNLDDARPAVPRGCFELTPNDRPLPEHLRAWRYAIKLPFRNIAVQLSMASHADLLALRGNSGVAHFRIFYEEKRYAFIEFIGSRSAIQQVLKLLYHYVTVECMWRWNTFERSRLEQRSWADWAAFFPERLQRLPNLGLYDWAAECPPVPPEPESFFAPRRRSSTTASKSPEMRRVSLPPLPSPKSSRRPSLPLPSLSDRSLSPSPPPPPASSRPSKSRRSNSKDHRRRSHSPPNERDIDRARRLIDRIKPVDDAPAPSSARRSRSPSRRPRSFFVDPRDDDRFAHHRPLGRESLSVVTTRDDRCGTETTRFASTRPSQFESGRGERGREEGRSAKYPRQEEEEPRRERRQRRDSLGPPAPQVEGVSFEIDIPSSAARCFTRGHDDSSTGCIRTMTGATTSTTPSGDKARAVLRVELPDERDMDKLLDVVEDLVRKTEPEWRVARPSFSPINFTTTSRLPAGPTPGQPPPTPSSTSGSSGRRPSHGFEGSPPAPSRRSILDYPFDYPFDKSASSAKRPHPCRGSTRKDPDDRDRPSPGLGLYHTRQQPAFLPRSRSPTPTSEFADGEAERREEDGREHERLMRRRAEESVMRAKRKREGYEGGEGRTQGRGREGKKARREEGEKRGETAEEEAPEEEAAPPLAWGHYNPAFAFYPSYPPPSSASFSGPYASTSAPAWSSIPSSYACPQYDSSTAYFPAQPRPQPPPPAAPPAVAAPTAAPPAPPSAPAPHSNVPLSRRLGPPPAAAMDGVPTGPKAALPAGPSGTSTRTASFGLQTRKPGLRSMGAGLWR